MADLPIDLYWSFRSPFSYLVTTGIKGLSQKYKIKVTVKPVYPLVIRVPDFFQKSDPRFFSYLLKDVERTAQMEGIPFAKPRPDPIVMDHETRTAAPDQPYIYRLNRIAAAASREGDILPLIDEIGTLIWSGSTQDWHLADHLSKAVERAGFDLKTLDEAAKAEPDALDAILQTNQEDLEAAGHWGVPTMVFNGEPFFGKDRLDLLVWRMKQHGLEQR